MQQNAPFCVSFLPLLVSRGLACMTLLQMEMYYVERECTPTSGVDPEFKVRGAYLNKLRRADGGAKIFGVFRVKNHIFSNFRGGAPPPHWIRPC